MEVLENAYIYGIQIEKEIVYIGKTYRFLDKRLNEHIQHCHNNRLKEAMERNDYSFVILYESHNEITDKTLCDIEKALISSNKPKYNIIGVSQSYETWEMKVKRISEKYFKNCIEEVDKVLEMVKNGEITLKEANLVYAERTNLTKENIEKFYEELKEDFQGSFDKKYKFLKNTLGKQATYFSLEPVYEWKKRKVM